MRVGIAGYGTQGSVYAGLIASGQVPGMELAAILAIDAPSRARAAADHPSVPCAATLTAFLELTPVEAVIVTTPHFEHPQVAIAALAAGRHVLVDKPIGGYGSQAAELIAAAAARPDLRCGVMLNQRANPLFARVKDLVAGGELGQVLRSHWIITTWWRPQSYYDQSPWRATWGGEGGGVLLNQAPHQLDLWQWICGLPAAVVAKVGYGFRRNIAVEDDVTVLADYGTGATGVFVTCTHDLAGTDRLEIVGTRGKVILEDSTHLRILSYHEPEEATAAAASIGRGMDISSGRVDPAALYDVTEVRADPGTGSGHAHVLADFARAVATGAPLEVPITEGLASLRLANAIQLSGWTGREVTLDFDDADYLSELNRRIAAEGKFPTRR